MAPTVGVLSLEQIRERLEGLGPGASGLDLLAGGPGDLPEGQSSMQRVISWSYDLLPEDLQAFFRRLSVFAGGFTLEAAASVCGSWDGRSVDVDALSSLTGASIVMAQPLSTLIILAQMCVRPVPHAVVPPRYGKHANVPSSRRPQPPPSATNGLPGTWSWSSESSPKQTIPPSLLSPQRKLWPEPKASSFIDGAPWLPSTSTHFKRA